MKPKFNLKLELIESRWRSRLVHLQLTVKPNVIFSCTCQGRQELVTINSWVRSIKKAFKRRQCIPKMRFVREEASSSSYWLI